MTNSNPTIQLQEEVSHFQSFYTGTPHAIKIWAATIVSALVFLALPIVLRSVMLYINLSRDATVVEAEANINEAVAAIQGAKTASASPEFSQFLMKQSELWSRQTILLSQLEKKIPKPDLIDFIMKYTGVIAALLALAAGLSTTIIAWKRERRETHQFLIQLNDRLAALQSESKKIVIP